MTGMEHDRRRRLLSKQIDPDCRRCVSDSGSSGRHTCERRATSLIDTYWERVVELCTEGLLDSEIAERLGISYRQVSVILYHSRKKGVLTPSSKSRGRHSKTDKVLLENIRTLVMSGNPDFGIHYTHRKNGVQHFRAEIAKVCDTLIAARLMNRPEKGRTMHGSCTPRVHRILHLYMGDAYHFQEKGDIIPCLICGELIEAPSSDAKTCGGTRSKCAKTYYAKRAQSNYRWQVINGVLAHMRHYMRAVRERTGTRMPSYAQLEARLPFTFDELFSYWRAEGRLDAQTRDSNGRFSFRYTLDNSMIWSVDHIRPLGSFMFTTYDSNDLEWTKCWVKENMRPLEMDLNQKKSAFWMGYYWRNGLPYSSKGVEYPKTLQEKEELRTELLRKHYELSNQPTMSEEGEIANE